MDKIQQLQEIDILNRTEFIEKIISTVEYHSKNSLKTSFSVQGEWGLGKSWILDRVFERLYDIQDEKIAGGRYCVFRYNAWKYDYYDEPLISLLISLKEQFETENSIILKTPESRQNFDTIKKLVNDKLFDVIESIQTNPLFPIIDSQTFHIPGLICFGVTVKKEFEKYKEKIKEEIRKYDPHYDLNQLMNSMIKGLNKISTEKTIVVIVDELDRCLPEHAIKVLERMHHISQNVQKIQFIYGIDKAQIEKNITEIFGIEDKSDRIKKYLSKFILFGLEVPNTEYNGKIENKYPALFKSFSCINTIRFNVIEKLQIIFSIMTPRIMEHIISKIILSNNVVNHEKKILDNSILVFESFYAISRETNFDWFNMKINEDRATQRIELKGSIYSSPMIDIFNKLVVSNPVNYSIELRAPNYTPILWTDYENDEEKALFESAFIMYFDGIKGLASFKFDNKVILQMINSNIDYIKLFCKYYDSLKM